MRQSPASNDQLSRFAWLKNKRSHYYPGNSGGRATLSCFAQALGARTRPRVTFRMADDQKSDARNASHSKKSRLSLRQRENTKSNVNRLDSPVSNSEILPRRVISRTYRLASPVRHRTRYRNHGRRSRCVSSKPSLRRCARRKDDQKRCGRREFFHLAECGQVHASTPRERQWRLPHS